MPQTSSSPASIARNSPRGEGTEPKASSVPSRGRTPQHSTVPIQRRAQVKLRPAVTSTNRPEGGEDAPEPSPPQHSTRPEGRIPQVCTQPADIWMNCPGGASVCPRDSRMLAPPQHSAVPSRRRPQLKFAPAVSRSKIPGGGRTVASLAGSPQQATRPCVFTTQVWSTPLATCRTSGVAVVTSGINTETSPNANIESNLQYSELPVPVSTRHRPLTAQNPSDANSNLFIVIVERHTDLEFTP